MYSSEALNDIIEDPTSDWGDDAYYEEDDDFDELQVGSVADENDQKDVTDLTGLSQISRPTTTKSLGSSLRSDGKRVRIRHQRQPLYSFNGVAIKRDPVVESIIESRKFAVIENPYTRLAQTTSQPVRVSQRTNPFEIRLPTTGTENEIKGGGLASHSGKRILSTTTTELDNDGWDDGLPGEQPRESVTSIDRFCVQLYEDTCKRLNICPCSMIVRSLNTTKLNLGNYGLGPRGCIALAAALIRNTTVISVNLSGNNIGNSGMSHIYQILTENTFIEEYDLSSNNLGSKGIAKLATAMTSCAQVKTLNVAGNELNANDINILLLKLEDHLNLRNLNISHNQLDDEGGLIVANWICDNNVLLNLDVSWCSIRLAGAKALAKAIGDNGKLITLDLSHNSFTNDTVESITHSLTRNTTLCELNLRGNQFISRYDGIVKGNPSILITGKESQIYKMIVAAATNQSLKILRLGRNHIDARCLLIMLESLSTLDNITLEELDLTGLAISTTQTTKIDLLFVNHPKLTCYVGPVRQTIEHFANNLLNLIYNYCDQNQANLSEMFNPNEGTGSISGVNYEQFLDGLRKAKIPFPIALIDDIMKYLGRDNDQGFISLKSLITG